MIKWVREGKRPEKIQATRIPPLLVSFWKQFELLEIKDEVLIRKWLSLKAPEENRNLIVVPEILYEDIMTLYHSNKASAHPGIAASTEKCRRHFYFPKMEAEFKLFLDACGTCAATKQPKAYLKASLNHIIVNKFNDCITIDHIVPSSEKTTPRGFRYILTITDVYSNYLVALPVRTQTSAENIRMIFRNWILIHGMSKEVICDNHPGFTSQFFEAVFKAFECKRTHGTAYSKHSTGKAENNNKRVNNALRCIIPDGKEHNWDLYLAYAVFALNSLKNRHSGYSANRLVYGR